MWASAAVQAGEETGVEIMVYSIGWRQDYEDTFFSWFDKREVEEKGAVFVRPDRTVAWRFKTPPVDEKVCGEKLMLVLTRVLGFKEQCTDEDRADRSIDGHINGWKDGQGLKRPIISFLFERNKIAHHIDTKVS